MTPLPAPLLALGAFLTLLAVPAWAQAPAAAASGADAAAATAAAPVSLSPAQLNRIKAALSQEPSLKLDDLQLRFYLEIIGKEPRFADYVKGYDFVNGPTRRGSPMTHQEFVSMVTPKELYSSVGITAIEQLQFALTNVLGQALIKKALDEIRTARDEREIQNIRERIERELAALKRAESR